MELSPARIDSSVEFLLPRDSKLGSKVLGEKY